MEGTCIECVFPLNMKLGAVTCATDTSLIYAAGQGKLSCVRELIAGGIYVNTLCECHGEGALHAAAVQEQRGRTPPLILAAQQGAEECTKELIKFGADVNIADETGDTALIHAADLEEDGIIQLLVENGTDGSAKNNKGETALYLALTNAPAEYAGEREGHLEKPEYSIHTRVVFMLLKAGAHLNDLKPNQSQLSEGTL